MGAEADDVLWRRSKLGLKASPDEREALAQFMAAQSAVERARFTKTCRHRRTCRGRP